jgi:hypothetical protein
MPGQAVIDTRAHDLHMGVVGACQAVRKSWVLLAGRLHAFHTERAWEQLGYESFTDWLGEPEIGLRRAQAYLLVEAWQELVLDRSVQPDQLAEADVTKVAVVLPALRRAEVDVETALADCAALSRSDLAERYRPGHVSDSLDASAERAICPTCGTRVAPGALA